MTKSNLGKSLSMEVILQLGFPLLICQINIKLISTPGHAETVTQCCGNQHVHNSFIYDGSAALKLSLWREQTNDGSGLSEGQSYAGSLCVSSM